MQLFASLPPAGFFLWNANTVLYPWKEEKQNARVEMYIHENDSF